MVIMKYTWIIKCPICSFEVEEEIPEDRCVYFYICKNCWSIIRPKENECCVFCSYSDTKCIPKQLEKSN